MANVGNLALKLSANPSGLRSGIDVAINDIKSFVGRAGNLLSSLGSGASGVFGALGGMAGGPWAIALGMASTLSGKVEGKLREIKELKKEAETLGLSVETWTGLKGAAGGEAEALATGMRHLARNAEELKGQTVDKAFLRIADEIKGMSSQSERAQAAFRAFGKQGQELLPLLAKGSDGIKANVEHLKEMGLVIKDADATKASAALKSIKEAGLEIKGAMTQVAIAFAPVIKAVADVTVKLAQLVSALAKAPLDIKAAIPGGNVTEAMARRAVEELRERQAKRLKKGPQDWDPWLPKEAIRSGPGAASMAEFQQMQKDRAHTELFGDVWGRAKKAADALHQKNPDIGEGEAQVAAIKGEVNAMMAKLKRDTAMIGKSAIDQQMNQFERLGLRKDVLEKMRGAMVDKDFKATMNDLEEETEKIKLGADAWELARKKKAGYSAEQLKDVEVAQLHRDAKKLEQEFKAPVVRFREEMDRLREMDRLIDVKPGVIDMKFGSEFAKLEAATGANVVPGMAQAHEEGSAAAISAANQYRLRQEAQSEDPQERIRKVLEMQLEQQRIAAEEGKKLREAWEKMQGKEEV